MKLISWNVNGLRACLQKGFSSFFEQEKADVFCIQETKMHPEQADIAFNGYQIFWNSAEKKGYSGTAVFTCVSPLSISYGMGIPEHDTEGRLITLEFADFFLVNVYTPNTQRGLLRLSYRMHWEEDFLAYLLSLSKQKSVIVCGDMNVAHQEIDIKNPKANIHNAGFTPEEREKMDTLLHSGFIDTFRARYPDQKDAYTWWSYMRKARERNAGWRIDYFLVSKELGPQVKDSFIYSDVLGSDHCPIGLSL